MNRDEYRGLYFGSHLQKEWNDARTKKLISILGTEWFPGKRILEVGCGHGDNGKVLEELGAHLTFTDGRALHIDVLKSEGYEAFVMDQDAPWTIEGTFDLIVHWGVSYHLENWKQDLECALQHTSLLCFETEVRDTEDSAYVETVEEQREHYDQALNGKGSRLSPNHLEAFFTSLGATFVRHDDPALNAGYMNYSWEAKNNSHFSTGQRRFWMVSR